jgi:hypothetical protein
MPGYFLDRYAYQVAKHGIRPEMPGFDVGAALARFREVVDQSWVPAEALNGWRPSTDQRVEPGPFYGDLGRGWEQYVHDRHLPDSIATVPDAGRLTWEEIAMDSVFYPRPPAIPGANYLDYLAPQDIDEILRRWGEQSAKDFFCFMLQVHEKIHSLQTGEPLVNEVVQCAVWSGFLDYSRLWVFQRNSQTDYRLPLEYDAVAAAPWLLDSIQAAHFDSLRAFSQVGSADTYIALCGLAEAFDRGEFRYKAYVSEATKVLLGTPSRQW